MNHTTKRNFHIPSQYLGVNLVLLSNSSFNDLLNQIIDDDNYAGDFTWSLSNDDNGSFVFDKNCHVTATSDAHISITPQNSTFYVYVLQADGTTISSNDTITLSNGMTLLYWEDRGTTTTDSFTPVDVPIYNQKRVAKANPDATTFEYWGLEKGGAAYSTAKMYYAPYIYMLQDEVTPTTDYEWGSTTQSSVYKVDLHPELYSSVGMTLLGSDPLSAEQLLLDCKQDNPNYAIACSNALLSVSGETSFSNTYKNVVCDGVNLFYLSEDSDTGYTGYVNHLVHATDGRYQIHVNIAYKADGSNQLRYTYNRSKGFITSVLSPMQLSSWSNQTTGDYYFGPTLLASSISHSAAKNAIWIGVNLNQESNGTTYVLNPPTYSTNSSGQIVVTNSNNTGVYFCFCPNQITPNVYSTVWYQKIIANKSFTFTNTSIKSVSGMFVAQGDINSISKMSSSASTPTWYHSQFSFVTLKNTTAQAVTATITRKNTDGSTDSLSYTIEANSSKDLYGANAYLTATFTTGTQTSSAVSTYCPKTANDLMPTVEYTDSSITATNPYWKYGFTLQYYLDGHWYNASTSEITLSRAVTKCRIIKDAIVGTEVSIPANVYILGTPVYKWDKEYTSRVNVCSPASTYIKSVTFDSGETIDWTGYVQISTTGTQTIEKYHAIVSATDTSGNVITFSNPIPVSGPVKASFITNHATIVYPYTNTWTGYYVVHYTNGTSTKVSLGDTYVDPFPIDISAYSDLGQYLQSVELTLTSTKAPSGNIPYVHTFTYHQ